MKFPDIVRRRLTAGREVAVAKSGILFFDYAARKVVSTPEPFRAAFAGAGGPDRPPEGPGPGR